MKYDELLNFDYTLNKTNLYNKLVSAISDSLESEPTSILIKDLTIVDETIDLLIELSEQQLCLEKAKNHYESIEDFESCAKCKSLLDKINSKKIKNVNGKNHKS
jgi:hypothetical protein